MTSKRKAVALKYIEGTEAPVILAKGEGRKADIMLEEAEKKGVPVTEDKVLVDIYTKETTLKDIQRRAKIRTLFADMLYGEEKDRNGTYELSK